MSERTVILRIKDTSPDGVNVVVDAPWRHGGGDRLYTIVLSLAKAALEFIRECQKEMGNEK